MPKGVTAKVYSVVFELEVVKDAKATGIQQASKKERGKVDTSFEKTKGR